MANVKISQLPSLSSLSGSDVFPVVSGNVTYNVTANAVANFVGGGGNANTGNVTFDNQIVIGTGDDFGGGGLYLAQGPNSVANLQYLRVRAGDIPSHIHLDTGNSEAYDQYFGDDGKYVKLEAGYTGNVVVGTDNGNGAVTWTFSSGGIFELPGGGIITNSSIADAEITIEANAAVNLYGGATTTPGQGGGWVNVSAGNGGPDDGTNAGSGGTVNISGGDGADAISNAVGVGGGIQLTGGSGGRANAANGIVAGAGGMVYIYGGSAGDVDGNVDLSVNGPNVEIHGGLGSFDNTTMIGRPGDVVVQGGGNGWIGASGNVYTKTSPDGYAFYDWKFDNAGNLTVPGSVNFTGGDIVQAPTQNFNITVQDSDNDDWALFNTVTDGTTPYAQTRLRRNEFRITTDITGVNQSWSFDDQGRFNLPGNIQGVYAGNSTFYAVNDGATGSVELKTISYAGDALLSNLMVDGNVVRVSTANAAHNWTFTNNGNLNIPGNISVVDTPVIAVTNENGFPGGPGGATLTAATSANPGESTIQVGWTVTGNNLVGTTTVTAVNDLGGGILEFVTDTAVTDPFWYNDVYTFTGTSTGLNVWNFGWNGALTLPGEGVVRSNDDTIILQSYDVANGVGRGLRVGTSGQLFLEQGANPAWLSFVANDGNAEIGAAPGEVNTGNAGFNLSLFGGSADTGVYGTGAGGNINLQAGLGAFNDGGGGGPGGSVNITAGNSADPAGVAGNVTINSGVDTWTFDNNGNLTLPGNTFAVNYANGTAVSLGGGGSSNAIVNGTSNVSIASTNGNITFGLNGSNAGKIASTSLALGVNAGNGQGTNSVAIGSGAGQTTQANNTVAVGVNAGNDTQGAGAIAVGRNAGQTTQGAGAVAVGATSGYDTQGAAAVAVGQNAGQTGQGVGAIAVGYTAGSTSQNGNAIAVGYNAGSVSQGANAIAIGHNAAVGGTTPQPAGSIAIVASGVDPTPLNAGLYVDPVRNDTGNVTNAVYYNTTTKEVTYGPAGGGGSLGNLSAAGNVIFLPDSPQPASFINYNTGSAMVLGTNSALPVSIVANYTSNAAQTWTFATSGELSAPGNISAVNFVGDGSTLSNVTTRSSTIAAANTKVTLNNITAQVGGSPIRLYIGATTSNLTVAGQSQTMTSGAMAVGSWINVPISTGTGNEFAMSGALSQNGDTAVLNITVQDGGDPGTWRITGLIANTSSNLYSVTIEQIA